MKKLIKAEYPKAKLDGLVITFSKKKPVEIVLLGPRGGETKVVLNDGSGLQKNFLNMTYVKRALGPTAREIINQTDIHIRKRQEEMKRGRADELIQQQNLKSKDEEIRGLALRMEKEEAKIDQLKENELPGNEEEIERKEKLFKNLKKDLKIKQKERGASKKIKKSTREKTTNFNQAFLKKKEK